MNSPPREDVPLEIQAVGEGQERSFNRSRLSSEEPCDMTHQSNESESVESRTIGSEGLLICEANYCKPSVSKAKRAYFGLSHDLYYYQAKKNSEEPTTLEQFRGGVSIESDRITVSRATEDVITRLRKNNSHLARVSTSQALLISGLPREILVVFDDIETCEHWNSAIKNRVAAPKNRVNEALNDFSTTARNTATAVSNISAAAGSIAGMAGTAQKLASSLGGVAIVGPVLNGLALVLSVVDRGLKTEEGRKKLPKLRSRLSDISKKLNYARKVLLAAMETDGHDEETEEIMRKVLSLFLDCSGVMGRIERQLMKSTFDQFLTASNFKSIDEDMAELDKKLVITHIAHLVHHCKQVDDRLKKIDTRLTAVETQVTAVDNHVNSLDNRVTAVDNHVTAVDNRMHTLENLREPESFVVNYASVPNIPTDVIRDAVPSFEKLKSSLMACSPENRSRSVAIWGDGGTGKTMACVLLANDKEIRKSFCDGIQFIDLGYDVSEKMLLKEVANVVENCGGANLAERLRKLLEDENMEDGNLKKKIMQLARNWMEGKNVLIVADNVWERSIVEIVSELAVASESGFLFTTRVMEVAQFVSPNTQFHFSPFVTDVPGVGRTSARLLFRRHLGSEVVEGSPESSRRDKLFETVSGLPLAIAIAARLVKAVGWDDSTSELNKYLQEPDAQPRPTGNHPGLHNIMTTGLRCLDNPGKPAARNSVRIMKEEYEELRKKHNGECFRTMYLALVVLSKSNTSLPIDDILKRLWGLDLELTRKVARAFCNVSLATVIDDAKLKLHDLQYQYCASAYGRMDAKLASRYRMHFLSTYCDPEQYIVDVNWTHLAFYSPQEKRTGSISGNLNAICWEGWELTVGLAPRDFFLANHIEDILKCIATDRACDPNDAEMASRAVGIFKKSYKDLSTVDPQDIYSESEESLGEEPIDEEAIEEEPLPLWKLRAIWLVFILPLASSFLLAHYHYIFLERK